jgi:hypothetical protein
LREAQRERFLHYLSGDPIPLPKWLAVLIATLARHGKSWGKRGRFLPAL